MLYEAHRGISAEYPENTMPAFQAAVEQHYDMIELDPQFTADGVCVVFHDITLNRTCRLADGSVLPEKVFITDVTYEELMGYDAGIFMGEAFAGTKVPKLAEVLAYAAEADIPLKLDNRFADFPQWQIDTIFTEVEQSGARVGFTCNNMDSIKQVVARFPRAPIHYDGPVDEEQLITLQKMVHHNPCTVWLALSCPQTDWVTVRRADAELAAMVKRYAKLGVWLLRTEEELKQAKALGADVIETTGTLKPRYEVGMFDCHTHTKYSHDSQCEPADSARMAKEKGLLGFAITDHCDVEKTYTMDIKSPIFASVAAAAELNGEIRVLRGVELGESLWFPHSAREVAAMQEYDMIIGSVHAVRYDAYTRPYSGILFPEMSEDELYQYLDAYFRDMLDMLADFHYDVLAHLTCPLRYVVKNFGRTVDMSRYREIIDEILCQVIKKSMSLEVNTSGVSDDRIFLMPDLDILQRYYVLGGRMITLASDAHMAERLGNQFEKVVSLLKEIGFQKAYYYEKRVAVPYYLP